jgi:hypothetical protein
MRVYMRPCTLHASCVHVYSCACTRVCTCVFVCVCISVYSWVQSAGGDLEDEEEGVVEVSPLVSYAGEGLEPLVQGKVFADAYDLSLQVCTCAHTHIHTLCYAHIHTVLYRHRCIHTEQSSW